DMQARGHCQAASKQEAYVLHVALTPTSVADEHVTDRGRCFFIGTLQISIEAYPPARATQQRGLNEIVADYMPAEGCLALEDGQMRRGSESLRADDGVVTPEVTSDSVPCRQAVAEYRAIKTVGELLQTAIETIRH